MADLTLSANNVAVHNVASVPRETSGQRRPPRRRVRRPNRDASLVQELYPDAEPGNFEVFLEFEGDEFIGVAIIETATGEAVMHIPVDELSKQADHAGLILERAV